MKFKVRLGAVNRDPVSVKKKRERELRGREGIVEFCLEEQLPLQWERPRPSLTLTLQERRVCCLPLACCQTSANHLCASFSDDLTQGCFCSKNQKVQS